MRDFYEIFRVCGGYFHIGQTLKLGDSFMGFRSYKALSLGVRFPVFIAEPPASSGPGRTHDEGRTENQDMKECQSFPMGSIDSTVGESSHSREPRPMEPFQEILSRGFQLFDEQQQLTVRQPS